ncbi:hypothetical protein CERZMDRAFT_102092 [Cercospora zeae-maydis SCOH1-5]|uniref:Uncharacterized protein n=1 Tax=Cercospora zeae-maydis SCOH1-5 TaxID=717836 RepID=A0A6A6F3D5_9PEZI|nr:hypothetical protein CERZMDRAFT_102092 [Cercospora zeae-maydis SCOH1-5]
MAAQQFSQYSSGYKPAAPGRHQSRGSQVPTQYRDAWISEINTSTAQRSNQGSWYQYSSAGSSSSAGLAPNDQFSNMGSWSQSSPARASTQDFNKYVDSRMGTKTSGLGQSKQQLSESSSGPLPWEMRWMPGKSSPPN